MVSSVNNHVDCDFRSFFRAQTRAALSFFYSFSFLPRGSDSEGEWREHHWENILSSHSLDPEQVRLHVSVNDSF